MRALALFWLPSFNQRRREMDAIGAIIYSSNAFWPIVIAVIIAAIAITVILLTVGRKREAERKLREDVAASYRNAKSHTELLATLIRHMETVEMPFYESNQRFSWTMWHVLSGMSLLTSLLTTLAAALIDEQTFGGKGKIVLLVLSLVTTGATAFLQLFRFREKEALREDGRIELEDIILNAYDRFILQQTPEEARKSFHEVRARFLALELAQHRQDVLLRQASTEPTDENFK